MAASLSLTDGTTTVSLLDTAALHMARRGWRPKVAVENAAGDDYEDVIEVVKLSWMQTTDDARDSTIQSIHKLARKAREYIRQRRVTGPVWLQANTPSETNVRYALVKDIQIAELDDWHYGPSQPVQLTISITREGAWRSIAPNTSPISHTALIGTQTIRNSVVAASGYQNYYDVAPGGDALALPIVYFTGAVGSTPSEMIIALRSRENAADVTPFNPHFNAADFGSTGTLVADGSAPGGQAWSATTTAATQYTNYVPLPAALTYYTGTFLVYAVVKTASSSVWQMQAGHGYSTSFAASDKTSAPVDIVGTIYHEPICLGRITMPASGALPGMVSPSNYYITLSMNRPTAGTSSTFSVRNVFLVPVDDGVISVTSMSQLSTLIDSTVERSWHFDPATSKYLQSNVRVRGRYLKLKPGWTTRIMFFWTNGEASYGVVYYNTLDSICRGALRYLALRGDT